MQTACFAERMFGWPAAETLGQPARRLYWRRRFRRHDLGMAFGHAQTRGPRKDGRGIVCNAASTQYSAITKAVQSACCKSFGM